MTVVMTGDKISILELEALYYFMFLLFLKIRASRAHEIYMNFQTPYFCKIFHIFENLMILFPVN